MKILQIANGYMGSKLYKNLFYHLQELDIENSVYVPVRVGSILNEEPLDSHVIVSECFTQIDRCLYYRKQNNMIRDIEKQVNISDIDIIHAHTLFSGGYAAWKLSQKYGIPYIVAVRNTDKNSFFRYMIHLRKVGVAILRGAQRVIFLSPKYRESIIQEYVPSKYQAEISEKSDTIPNGIDPRFFDASGEGKRAFNPQKPRFIYVGEISKNKNIEATIQVLEILKSQGLYPEFTVIGPMLDSRYDPLFQKTENLHYLGKKPLEQVLFYLRNHDIFVMPSIYETFGLVYAEAMSQGLPVLYTKDQGFDGQFPEGLVGYHIDSKDPKDIAVKIMDVIENYDEMSKQCVSLCRKFDWTRIAKQYQMIYEQVTRLTAKV